MLNNTSSILAPICTDQTLNGQETDEDCGGGLCPKCEDGLKCQGKNDCISDVCGAGTCQAPICTDQTLNGQETDEDCGGGLCPKCEDGLKCQGKNDCISDVCGAGICQ
ncbi:unnamed protein product, partial [Rotaria sordida]